MSYEEVIALLEDKFGHEIIVGKDELATPKGVYVVPDRIHDVCQELFNNSQTYFDSLSCITGLDNGPEAGTMEVIYNVYSIPFDHHLMLKVRIERDTAEVPSVSHVWKTADWLERETFDLLGIKFTGHPDLRRILLPKDWEGHPLRKDYQLQERYHGIKVEY